MKGKLNAVKNLLTRRLFIVLLIIAQILLIVSFIQEYAKLRWLSEILNIISLFTALHLLIRSDKSAFKLSLVFLILLFPLFGGTLYWIMHLQTTDIGYRKLFRHTEEQSRLASKHHSTSADAVEDAIPESKRLMYY